MDVCISLHSLYGGIRISELTPFVIGMIQVRIHQILLWQMLEKVSKSNHFIIAFNNCFNIAAVEAF
jgi:hypothetical protein